MNQSSSPEVVACMIVDGCLKKALEATQGSPDERSTSKTSPIANPQHGILISRHYLESIANWLGMELNGDTPQLDEVFGFVQSTVEDSGCGRSLSQEAPKITIALDRQSPCITFVTTA